MNAKLYGFAMLLLSFALTVGAVSASTPYVFESGENLYTCAFGLGCWITQVDGAGTPLTSCGGGGGSWNKNGGSCPRGTQFAELVGSGPLGGLTTPPTNKISVWSIIFVSVVPAGIIIALLFRAWKKGRLNYPPFRALSRPNPCFTDHCRSA